MSKILQRLGTLSLALLITACATQQSTKPRDNTDIEAVIQARQAQLSAQDHWRLRGKIGLRSPQQNGSGFIDWQQQAESFRLQVSGPLGQGSSVISGGPEHLHIEGQPEQNLQDAQQQALSRLGWPLPHRQMPYWVRGLPAPQESYEARGRAQQLELITQSGWQIEYLRYSRHRMPLPEKIKLKRENIQITLVIKRWQ